MLKHSDAIVQVTRLAQYGRAYVEMKQEGIDELIKALKLACLDKRHGERVIDAWVRENRWMPTVSDIYATADRIQDRPDPPATRYQCKKCSGSGWQQAWVMVTRREDHRADEKSEITEEIYEQLRHTVDGFQQSVYTAAKACDCDYGKFLANARWVQKQKEMAEADGRVKR